MLSIVRDGHRIPAHLVCDSSGAVQVVQAARNLFIERGYPATTMEAISERSDVPPATVYRLFSSKLGILKALIDLSVAGTEDAVALADQPTARALLAEPDPAAQLAGFAAICREVNARTERLYRILVSAAESDPDATALLAERTRHRSAGQDLIARSLAHAGALRPDVREPDAADIIHALMSPEVWDGISSGPVGARLPGASPRPSIRASGLFPPEVDAFVGQVTDSSTLSGVMDGIDTVFSTVGITRQRDRLRYRSGPVRLSRCWGRSGAQLIEQALGRGHLVTAVARAPTSPTPC
jgi:AcrR family transcriptional regulator